MLFHKARATEYLKRCGLDVLIATSSANITYFSDYFCWIDPLFKEYMTTPGASSDLFQAFAIFPLEGDPALVLGPMFVVNAADSWVRDVVIFGDPGMDSTLSARAPEGVDPDLYQMLLQPSQHATPTDALLSVLQARGLTAGRIGIEMNGLTPKARAALLPALPNAQIKDATELIRMIRAVKSQDEIARLTKAAEISEKAGMQSLALAQPGRRISEVIEAYRVKIAEMGADFDHFAYGKAGMGIATEPDYVLRDYDVMYVDWGCLYQHYFSDTGTTLAIAQPQKAIMERFHALRRCMDAAIDLLSPGVKVSAVQAAMQDTLKEHGITASFPHGHGLDVEVRNYPIIVPDNGLHIHDDCIDIPSDLPLEVDMVVNLEAPLFMPGVGSLHIEQTFVITDHGSRPLIPQNRAAPFIH